MGKKQPWESEREMSPGGSELIRHELNDKVLNPQLSPRSANMLSESDMDAITQHIEACIGEVDGVFHEIMSDDLHIDVNMVSPTEHMPFNFLCTMGMSALAMKVPRGFGGPRYAEVCIYLPKNWPLTQEAFEKHGEDFYWPVRWLKNLARLPNQFDTFLGPGHTIPNGDPAEPLSPHCKFAGFVIIPMPIEEFYMLKVGKREIGFYMIAPLYPEEMDLKLKKGMDALFDAWDAANLGPTDMANPKRANVGLKRR